MPFKSLFAGLALMVLSGCGSPEQDLDMSSGAAIIEVVTLKLKDGVTYAAFAPIDKAVETEHVSKQPGFISRESASGEDGEWLVIVHWRSEEEADASMASFAAAPAAEDFMSMIDPSTMVMKRYQPK